MKYEQTELFGLYGLSDQSQERVNDLLKEIREIYRDSKKSILNKESVVCLSADLINERTEKAMALLLDSQNNVVKTLTFEGTVNKCLIEPREIIKDALINDCLSIILVHNHPGGSLEFSGADITLTKKIYEGANYFDINCLDHVLISHEGSLSMRETEEWKKISTARH